MLSKESVPAAIDPDLLALLIATVAVGDVVDTIQDGKPNRIEAIHPSGVVVATEKSDAEGKVGHVAGWMLNIGWRELQTTGHLLASELRAPGMRSSAVCAILARLPGVEVASDRPVALSWNTDGARITIPSATLAAYEVTQLTIEIDGRWLGAAEAVERLGSPIHVVTAWNPRSQQLTLDENHRRQKQLFEAVDQLDVDHYRAAGSSPDGAWTEQSLAILGINRDEARRLGREFDQYAIFELAQGMQRVVSCDGSDDPEPASQRREPGFFVYENWVHTFTKVHRGSCSFCNDGQGMHGAGSRTPSGEWHGPFASAAAAFEQATDLARRHPNRTVWSVGSCSICAPQ